jgi:hypothetical protein
MVLKKEKRIYCANGSTDQSHLNVTPPENRPEHRPCTRAFEKIDMWVIEVSNQNQSSNQSLTTQNCDYGILGGVS